MKEKITTKLFLFVFHSEKYLKILYYGIILILEPILFTNHPIFDRINYENKSHLDRIKIYLPNNIIYLFFKNFIHSDYSEILNINQLDINFSYMPNCS